MAAGVALLAPTALLGPVLIAVRGALHRCIAGLICAQAEVVLLMTALSLVHGLTSTGILVGELVLAGAVVALWVRGGRPRFIDVPISFRGLRGAAVAHPAIALLVLGAGAALLFQLFMGLAVAPNEYDSLLYHLPRAALWVQQHTALAPPDALPGDPRVVSAPNAELISAWTMALSQSDRLVALVQWLSVLGLGGVVVAGARLLSFPTPAALFAGALAVILPETILQAATPQNDAMVSFEIAAAALFGVRALRDRSLGQATVASAAAGLAVGTKGSVVFAVVPLLILWGAALWRWRPPVPWLAVAAGTLVGAIILLGSFNYIDNVVRFGSPSGGIEKTVGGDFAKEGRASNPVLTLARLGWVFVDASGAPVDESDHPQLPLVATIQRRLAHLRNRVFSGSRKGGPDPPLKTDVSDDESGYGLIGLLWLWPVLLYRAFGPAGRTDQRLLALAALAYFVTFALGLGYSVEAARLLMPFVALAAPLLAVAAMSRFMRPLTVVVALANVFPCLVLNQDKPLLQAGRTSILSADRLSQQLIDSDVRPMVPVLRRLEQTVPTHASLGFVLQRTPRLRALDYVLRGSDLKRRVVQLDGTQVSRSEVIRRHLDGVVLWDPALPFSCARPPCRLPPAGLRTVALGAGALLMRPSP